jgi:hypothetical protein
VTSISTSIGPKVTKTSTTRYAWQANALHHKSLTSSKDETKHGNARDGITSLVLSRHDKARIVRSELEDLSSFLEKSGSDNFYDRVEQLRVVVASLLTEWRSSGVPLDREQAAMDAEDECESESPDGFRMTETFPLDEGDIRERHSSAISEHHSSAIHEHHPNNIPEHHSSAIPEHHSNTIPENHSEDIQDTHFSPDYDDDCADADETDQVDPSLQSSCTMDDGVEKFRNFDSSLLSQDEFDVMDNYRRMAQFAGICDVPYSSIFDLDPSQVSLSNIDLSQSSARVLAADEDVKDHIAHGKTSPLVTTAVNDLTSALDERLALVRLPSSAQGNQRSKNPAHDVMEMILTAVPCRRNDEKARARCVHKEGQPSTCLHRSNLRSDLLGNPFR